MVWCTELSVRIINVIYCVCNYTDFKFQILAQTGIQINALIKRSGDERFFFLYDGTQYHITIKLMVGNESARSL